MQYPSPEDSASAPVWQNYIIAQSTQASLGLIPEHALAFGVRVSDARVCLWFQLSELTEGDQSDIDSIVNSLKTLVGDGVEVVAEHELRIRRQVSPHDGVSWIFLAHEAW